MDRHANAVWKGTLTGGSGTIDSAERRVEEPALLLQGPF